MYSSSFDKLYVFITFWRTFMVATASKNVANDDLSFQP